MMKSISHGSLRLLQNDEATELVINSKSIRRFVGQFIVDFAGMIMGMDGSL